MLLGLCAAGAICAVVLGMAGRSDAVRESPAEMKKAKSKELTIAPVVDFRDPAQPHYSGLASIQSAVQNVGADIPLPEGGNFNGIRWDDLEYSVSASDVQTLLQNNAACQWWRAARDRREPAVASAIVADIPWWSAVRATDSAPLAQKVFEQLSTGQGAELRVTLAQCDAVHQRSVQYSRTRGLTPSK
jgi:5,10-methenyltetrahydromethanopterin hydrogenase